MQDYDIRITTFSDYISVNVDLDYDYTFTIYNSCYRYDRPNKTYDLIIDQLGAFNAVLTMDIGLAMLSESRKQTKTGKLIRYRLKNSTVDFSELVIDIRKKVHHSIFGY